MTQRDEWDAMAVVGSIARAHGNKGDVIVNPETDFLEERFRAGAVFATWRGNALEHIVVDSVRFQQGRPVMHVRGVDSIEAAEALAGAEMRIPVAELIALDEGRYYRHDLVGCRVELVDGLKVGTVASVESDAGNDRLVVEGERGEVLVPMAAPIVRRVDIAARRIVIDPPEGLLELNERSGTRRTRDRT
jgi:16S rRNA processing protein RimM